MYFLLDILLVFLGASMLWYRERLARYLARVQQNHSRAWPWAYPGIIGRLYTSEKAWRNVFIPILAVASLFVGVIWLWEGVY
jgi:predicted membrane protein